MIGRSKRRKDWLLGRKSTHSESEVREVRKGQAGSGRETQDPHGKVGPHIGVRSDGGLAMV